MKGIHRESPWCAPGTLLIQCRLHKTKKHTVFSDALTLLESVIEDELVGNRTHASFAEVQGAGPEQGLCARVYLAVGKEIETARERVVSST